MSKPRILVADELDEVVVERGLQPVVSSISQCFDLVKLSDLAKEPEEERKKVKALLMIWFNIPKVDDKLLEVAPGLAYVQTCTKGVNHIDLSLCKSRGIRVGNLPDVYSVAVAEHAIALMFACTRHIIGADKVARTKSSETDVKFEIGAHHGTSKILGTCVNNKTLGIVGLGAIGLKIAKLATGLNLTVTYNDIKPRSDLAEHGLPEFKYFAKLEELLAQADVVILALPSIPQTRGMMQMAQLMSMKKDAVLVNIARGDVIKSEDLYEVMKSGHLREVALDVTDPEPLPPNDPLLTLENLTLSPHIAYYSDSGMKLCSDIALKALKDFHAGSNKLDNEVDCEKGF